MTIQNPGFREGYDAGFSAAKSHYEAHVAATDADWRAASKEAEAVAPPRPKFKSADERMLSAIDKAIHALNRAHERAAEAEDRIMYGAAGMLLETLFKPNPAAPSKPEAGDDRYGRCSQCGIVKTMAIPSNCVRQACPLKEPEAQKAVARCSNCDDTGHVSSITGEWRGRCHCEAGRTAPPLFSTAGICPQTICTADATHPAASMEVQGLPEPNPDDYDLGGLSAKGVSWD